MYNLTEYNDYYYNDSMTDFSGANNTGLLNFKEQVTAQTNADGTKKLK